MKNTLLASLVFFASVACASTSEDTRLPEKTGDARGQTADEAAPMDSKQSAPEADKQTKERRGVLVPAEAQAVSLWPRAYRGELLVLEVAAHGSAVETGDVIAQLDTRSLEEEIADAELELDSARLAHEGLIEKNRMAEETAASKLARTEAALARSLRSLQGYETRELEFTRLSDELSARAEAARIEDQLDELAQLESMYAADELVDQTEDIVLKRSRRQLAMSRSSIEISKGRRDYRAELQDELTAEAKREDVAKKEEALAHLRRSQALEAAARADGAKRSKAALVKKVRSLEQKKGDLALLTVRAPRAGVLLHGSMKELRAGSTKRYARGGKLGTRTDLFLVAVPDRMAVALSVPESLRAELADGAVLKTCPVAGGDMLDGKLTLASYPTSKAGEESAFDGTVTVNGGWPGVVCGMYAKVELTRSEP